MEHLIDPTACKEGVAKFANEGAGPGVRHSRTRAGPPYRGCFDLAQGDQGLVYNRRLYYPGETGNRESSRGGRVGGPEFRRYRDSQGGSRCADMGACCHAVVRIRPGTETLADSHDSTITSLRFARRRSLQGSSEETPLCPGPSKRHSERLDAAGRHSQRAAGAKSLNDDEAEASTTAIVDLRSTAVGRLSI